MTSPLAITVMLLRQLVMLLAYIYGDTFMLYDPSQFFDMLIIKYLYKLLKEYLLPLLL